MTIKSDYLQDVSYFAQFFRQLSERGHSVKRPSSNRIEPAPGPESRSEGELAMHRLPRHCPVQLELRSPQRLLVHAPAGLTVNASPRSCAPIRHACEHSHSPGEQVSGLCDLIRGRYFPPAGAPASPLIDLIFPMSRRVFPADLPGPTMALPVLPALVVWLTGEGQQPFQMLLVGAQDGLSEVR